ncbi:MAG: ribonuclease J, partial [Clostridia bacterium]|nr:ribonuclease J [Clostridia bacterium]
IIVIDCGSMFPNEDLYGIDLVIPDTTYLEKNIEKLRAFIITHGHEDHIGAIPYVFQKINAPIYCTRLTQAVIENKLKEYNMPNKIKMHCIKAKETVNIGCFSVDFIKTNHSIAGAVALAIHTPVGTIIHTGDFKVDYTPVDGDVIDLAAFSKYGEEGVLLLMSDSTNAEREGFTMSESRVGECFEKYFDEGNENRIIVATFASNVHRIQQIVDCAEKHNRKICFLGRSMENVSKIAAELGELVVNPKTIITPDKAESMPKENVVIITTGSQGEPMSGLARLASGDHSRLKLTKGDMVIVSASAIPGNEKMVYRVINNLYRLGVVVIYEALETVHVSGHACKEELKLILSLTKPKYFMPVHGEYRHLMQHAMLAEKLGIESGNIFMPEIGKVLEIGKNEAKHNGSVPAGVVMVDGLGIGDVGNVVLRDRRVLSQDGLLVVCITLSSTDGSLLTEPDIISRGFIYMKDNEELIHELKDTVHEIIEDMRADRLRDWSYIKNEIRHQVKDFLYSKTKRTPMILPMIIEI